MVVVIIPEVIIAFYSLINITKLLFNEFSKRSCLCIKAKVVSVEEDRGSDNSSAAYNVWQYVYNGEIRCYDSKIASRIFANKVGTESRIYIKKNGKIFEEKENRMLLIFYLIFFVIWTLSILQMIKATNP